MVSGFEDKAIVQSIEVLGITWQIWATGSCQSLKIFPEVTGFRCSEQLIFETILKAIYVSCDPDRIEFNFAVPLLTRNSFLFVSVVSAMEKILHGG